MDDYCKCGRVKNPVMEVCGVCVLQRQYAGEKKFVPVRHDHYLKCKECHNDAVTVDGYCADPTCSSVDWQQTACENITNILGTGTSIRHNSGKPQLDEVDPSFILGIAEIMTLSKAKYPTGNWMKPTKWSVPYDSLQRHLLAFQSGQDVDSESNRDHLLHAATNLMILYYHYSNNPESDDRLFKKAKK